jgi:hypothetical protein
MIEGKMGYECNGVEGILSVGDAEVCIDPLLPHRFWPMSGFGDMKTQVRVDPTSPGG